MGDLDGIGKRMKEIENDWTGIEEIDYYLAEEY
jgi:hypothetical protein